MGLVDNYIGKKVSKYLDKIEKTGQFEYNFPLFSDAYAKELRDKFSRNLIINSTWYGGNELDLKNLYMRVLPTVKTGSLLDDTLNYFWSQSYAQQNVRQIHTGIPQLISQTMATLLLVNGYEFNIYKDLKMETEDEQSTETLLAILEDNEFESQLHEAIESESWGGGVAFKWIWVKGEKYPYLELIQPECYEPIIEYGRIIADVFIKYIEANKKSYKLKEIYGVENGTAFIDYKLFRFDNTKWIEVELNELQDTRDLKRITFPGINEKLSLYKANKVPNSEFRGSKLGESDYAGSHGLFDALDEVMSKQVQEFRDGQIRTFWPVELLPQDKQGNSILPPSLKKDFLYMTTGIGQNDKQKTPIQLQGDIHSEKYIESYKKILEQILNNAGLSPQTIGVTGLDSTAASEESQELREKTSVRTREKKLALWKPYLMKLWNKGLKLFDYMHGVTPVDRIIDLNFGDYKVETVEQRTDVATKGITGKNWSILEGVKYTHKELTPEEQLLMAINIKIENGIMIFTKEEEAIYKKFIGELQSTPQIEPVSEVEDIDVEEDEPNEPAEPVGEEDGTTDRQE